MPRGPGLPLAPYATQLHPGSCRRVWHERIGSAGFRSARRGQVQRAVRLIVVAGLGFGTVVLFLREDSGVSIAATFLALTAYVALFSSRLLYVTSTVAALSLLASEVLGGLGLLPRFALAPLPLLGLKVGLVVLSGRWRRTSCAARISSTRRWSRGWSRCAASSRRPGRGGRAQPGSPGSSPSPAHRRLAATQAA
jgi:hypothetical protein